MLFLDIYSGKVWKSTNYNKYSQFCQPVQNRTSYGSLGLCFPYLFFISSSFGATEGQYFVIMAYLGYLHIIFGYLIRGEGNEKLGLCGKIFGL